ncbi:MAG: hypothetical protein FJY67_11765 [Calditrichaeota bacterium]|nr:hypothetical protein [Calditrichota bacterium]
MIAALSNANIAAIAGLKYIEKIIAILVNFEVPYPCLTGLPASIRSQHQQARQKDDGSFHNEMCLGG